MLGYNGAGKSTLLRIMAGVDQEYRGEAALAPGATVGMLAQEPHLDESKDVKGNVRGGRGRDQGAARPLQRAGGQLLRGDRRRSSATSRRKIDAADAWNLDTQLEYAMDALRLPRRDADVEHALRGERRRVALCRLLLSAPDLLLLDEPTNHLDAESVAWLEQHLAEYKGTIVAVTHDRYFLDNVAGWILELDRGRGIPYEGNYSSWLEQKQARLDQEERAEKGRRADDRGGARVGADEPEGQTHEVQGAPGPLRAAARRGAQRQARRGADPHPAGAAAGREGVDARATCARASAIVC